MAIPTWMLMVGGATVAGGSLLLAAQHANTASPPPDPNEDTEFEGGAIDLTPYYVGGFVGAMLFGAGVVLTIRGKPATRIPVVG